MAQESSALAVVVDRKMQELTRTETKTNRRIDIIAVGRDDLSKHNNTIVCGRKGLPQFLPVLLSCRWPSCPSIEKIYGQTWIPVMDQF